ncbi:SRPBCC family protein [Kitasatospora acidiphila]|uniref:SRPBCC family protein n=1 Tax=Kitasatospora acidiphila TaxID=2567942 RepID=A0A540VWL0_9ACTN|nr:SRPBCC family protein [Kitasatospora acidiphila]TQF01156.1 SRPBCC family protein [Kitasatospora acidiphila]
MSTVTESIEVDAPLTTCYNQWTQFETFPEFMDGVEEVTQLDDRHNHWRTKIAGGEREFDTGIVDQRADDRIVWRTVAGEAEQRGMVSFQSLDATHTKVSLAMEFDPQGMGERTADALGMVDRRVKGDLGRFKELIEHRGSATGGWRGRITPG